MNEEFRQQMIEELQKIRDIVSAVQDPMNLTKPCEKCGAEIRYSRGVNCGKWLARHPREGCTPEGSWKAENPPGIVDAEPIAPPEGAECATPVDPE